MRAGEIRRAATSSIRRLPSPQTRSIWPTPWLWLGWPALLLFGWVSKNRTASPSHERLMFTNDQRTRRSRVPGLPRDGQADLGSEAAKHREVGLLLRGAGVQEPGYRHRSSVRELCHHPRLVW